MFYTIYMFEIFFYIYTRTIQMHLNHETSESGCTVSIGIYVMVTLPFRLAGGSVTWFDVPTQNKWGQYMGRVFSDLTITQKP